jgi:hypothetical protein
MINLVVLSDEINGPCKISKAQINYIVETLQQKAKLVAAEL